MKSNTFKILLFLATESFINGQIAIVDSGAGSGQINLAETYTQNFDSLASPINEYPWVDDTTLKGWYSTSQFIRSFTGTGLQSAGPIGGLGDRSLGTTGTLSGIRFFALTFSNNSSSVISSLSVKFDGEQWRWFQNNPPHPSTLVFHYYIFEAGQGRLYYDDTLEWTSVPALDFNAPRISLPTVFEIDGNLPENSERDIQAFISGISLAPGQEIWLRWGSLSVPYLTRNQDLSIDNLSVSFTTIPEPATYAGLVGLVALTVAARRRSRPHC